MPPRTVLRVEMQQLQQQDAALDEAKATETGPVSMLPAFNLLQLRLGHDDDADEPVDQSYEM